MNDERQFKQDATRMLRELKAYTRIYFGPRCPDYDEGCACCRAWKAVDIVKELGAPLKRT